MTWKPLRTVPDEMIGRSILVWVPKNRCVFAVVPYDTCGRSLRWWGPEYPHQFKFPYKATQWMPMPKAPTKKGKSR